ncbi:MAG: Cys-tRNA(Pro)/Cys-tRNA(Cys) deacylase [Cellvibrionaceae bacterium]|jgi:Cys-tRNA(Pro)/Cys-tRNA(Cys) deacylase
MTPAINAAKKLKITYTLHEYSHDAAVESFGLEAVEKLNVAPERVFKTLIVFLDNNELVVGVIPVPKKLSLKLIAKAMGEKKAAMADKLSVERTTGYVLGGVSPLGQKKRLKSVIDASAMQFETIFVSAGRRGLEIELSPKDLIMLTSSVVADIAQ